MGALSLEITDWSDTQIVATTPICGGEVTVNALFGSASVGDDCCEGDIDADGDVDGPDAAGFKGDFGRNPFRILALTELVPVTMIAMETRMVPTQLCSSQTSVATQ